MDDAPRGRKPASRPRSHKIPTAHTPHQPRANTTRPRVSAGQKPDNWAPAIGLEPITCRLTGVLSHLRPSGPVSDVSPLHPHRGLSEAYRATLAAVPPCTA